MNSPETLNAFTGPMHTSMSRIWDDVNDDPDVHVVVLTGSGRAFSAGGNVIAMQKKIDDPDAWDAGMPEARRIVFRMLECDKPIIARVNGHAVGQEFIGGAGIGPARVRVADVGGEEFEEAHAGALAGGGHERGEGGSGRR